MGSFEQIRQSVRLSGSTALDRVRSLSYVRQYWKPEIMAAVMSDLSEEELKQMDDENAYVNACVKVLLNDTDNINMRALNAVVMTRGKSGKWFAINCTHEGLKKKHETSPYYGGRLFVEMFKDSIEMIRSEM